MLVTLGIDTQELNIQVHELKKLLTSQRAFDFIDSELPHLLDDLITSDGVLAEGADNAFKFIISIKFGSRFSDVMATLRAINIEGI